MLVQIVKLMSKLSEAEVLATAKDRAPKLRAIPGLIQKYCARLAEPDPYAGVYVWDSRESMATFRASDLAASIPAAYKIMGAPNIETMDLFLSLRD